MANPEAIRADLEATKRLFHQLLDGITLADWNKRTSNTAWNVRELVSHICDAVDYTTSGIDRIRKGKNFSPPSFIANRVNVMMTRRSAREATPRSCAARYDEAHARLLAKLDTISDADWKLSAKLFGRRQTIEDLYRQVATHFQEHAADIRGGLGQV